MKHTNTRSLYEYWNKQRKHENAPLREDIHPGDIKWLLPSMFILEHHGDKEFPFTLAGTHLCDHYGMELRGLNMCDFWRDAERVGFNEVLLGVIDDNSVGIIGFNAHTNLKNVTKMEMIVMPLRSPKGRPTRIVGSISAFSTPVWSGKDAEKITHHEISSLRMLAPGQDTYTHLNLRSEVRPLEGARPFELEEISGTTFTAVRHLRVIEGGRQD